MLKELIKLANELDKRGLLLEANLLDSMLPIKKASIELYHGTITNLDMSNIVSFRQGISLRDAGHGQGNAFFLFSDKDKVVRRLRGSHAKLSPLGPFYEQILPEEDGYPMIVTVEVDEVSPEDFDLDAEVEAPSLSKFMMDNIDKIRQLPDRVLVINAGRGGKSKSEVIFSETEKLSEDIISFAIEYIDVKRSDNGSLSYKFKKTKLPIYVDDVISMDEAATRYAPIFNFIQRQLPELVYEFEKEMFKQLSTRTMAIKYTNPSKPLNVKKLEAFIDNEWVDVTSQAPPIPDPDVFP